MSTAAIHHHAHDEHGVPHSSSGDGPASKPIIVAYGFWIFLLSDIIMFSAIFATYAVLSGATNGGPTGAQLFDYTNVAIETGCLLASSFTCGMMMIAVHDGSKLWATIGAIVTFVLGAIFLGLEINEFADMIAKGASPQRSAFLSSFFTLVGCHGVHVAIGLLWLVVMTVQIWAKGFRDTILRRLACFSLFWHALDIIWVALFSIVYLMGGGH